MKKHISILLALLLCISLFAACAENPHAPSDEPTAQTAETAPPPNVDFTPTPTIETPTEPSTPEFVSFTDSVERTVEIPSQITRVSPSGPVAQMFLLAIAPDLMVTAASKYSDAQMEYLPAGIATLPVVGQFYGSADINFETIASVNPQLVIDVGEPKGTIIEDMDEIMTTLAIPSVHITATLRSSPEAFRELGKLLGREEKGEQLALYCEKILAQTDDIMTKVGDNKVNALYCLGDTGQNVIAQTSFHAEVLDFVLNNLAVVDNPAGKGTGNETDIEQISVWNPDFIIFGYNSVYGTVAADGAWSAVPAIGAGYYVEAPSGPYDWIGNPPSINRYLSMMWLTKLLYPDFADFDLYAQVREYYNLFYGYELSEAKYAKLTENAFTICEYPPAIVNQ